MRFFLPRRAGRLRKAIGVILSLLLLAGYYSPTGQAIGAMPGTLSLARGQSIALQSGFPFRISVQSGDVQVLASQDESLVSVQAGQSGHSRLGVSLFGLLPIRDVEVRVADDTVLIPGGQAVGVAMQTKGVLVVGTSDLSGKQGASPARLAGVRSGDLILAVDGVDVTDTDQFVELMGRYAGKPLPLTVQRGDLQLQLALSPVRDEQSGAYRIGAWVRDSTAGVGTLSFVWPNPPTGDGSALYGALGHAITDGDTQQVLPVSKGRLMQADIVDVRIGQRGEPGELKGSFLQEARLLGDIQQNTSLGLYGGWTAGTAHPLYPDGLPIGRKDAVHTGKASILSTVGPEGMREYEVEITRVYPQDEPAQRSMVIRVTDKRLIKATGGIVQGMSGSPILQDGRIVGAVTHVYVSDPTQGYGLYIEWMMQEALNGDGA